MREVYWGIVHQSKIARVVTSRGKTVRSRAFPDGSASGDEERLKHLQLNIIYYSYRLALKKPCSIYICTAQPERAAEQKQPNEKLSLASGQLPLLFFIVVSWIWGNEDASKVRAKMIVDDVKYRHIIGTLSAHY